MDFHGFSPVFSSKHHGFSHSQLRPGHHRLVPPHRQAERKAPLASWTWLGEGRHGGFLWIFTCFCWQYLGNLIGIHRCIDDEFLETSGPVGDFLLGISQEFTWEYHRNAWMVQTFGNLEISREYTWRYFQNSYSNIDGSKDWET